MELNTLIKVKLDNEAKRKGRGRGSGKGAHTVGRGSKGQKARKGAKFVPGFEGGQVPLYKKLPEIGGFINPSQKEVTIVELSIFEKFKDDDEVTPQTLLDRKTLKYLPSGGVKILSGGKFTKKLKFSGFLYSASAKAEIEKTGSKINA